MGVESLVKEKPKVISKEERFDSFLWEFGLQAAQVNPVDLIKAEKSQTERYNEKGPWNVYLFAKKGEKPQVKILCSTYESSTEVITAINTMQRILMERNKDTTNTGLVIEHKKTGRLYAGYFHPIQNPESIYSEIMK